ncbi:hypothetical protein IM538_13095 [Cytobacillus suaedae]|nr:hypothetical protein IM538_13095 [Cytobacillus suaedae]
MKNFLMCFFIIGLLFMTACSQHEETISEDESIVLSDKEVLLHKSEKLLNNLKELNWTEFSKEVHPEKGLTFSFYADIGSPNSNEITFTKNEVEKFSTDEEIYTWGYDFSDKAYNYTANEYVTNYLLSHLLVNPLDYTEITYNENYFVSGGIINTIHEYYPEAIFVEYHSPPPTDPSNEYAEYQWQQLRFVYEQVESEWYLFAIVRDVHSP